MKVKELKQILNVCTDDAEVVVSDLRCASIHIEGADEFGGILYIDVAQYFPDEWYDEDGLEELYER